MAYEQKPGDLSIFKNDYKDADNKPDYKGKGLDLQGMEIEIALWVKEGAKGKFFSGRISKKYEKMESKPTPTVEHPEEDDDGLPF